MLRSIIVSCIVSLSVSIFGFCYLEDLFEKKQNELIQDFYESENAVIISPHSLRKKMTEKKNDFVLVDLRSEQEYKHEHIIGAINVPAYKTPDKSAYDDKERIIASFQKIIAENPGKDIIVHCYSSACMTWRKIGKMLSEKGIYVKHLGIGWNEWRYSWNLWNHDGEAPSKVEDYIVSEILSSEKQENSDNICTQGEFNC